MVLTGKRLTADFVNKDGQWNFQGGEQIDQTHAQDTEPVSQISPQTAAREGTHGSNTHLTRERRVNILWTGRAAVESGSFLRRRFCLRWGREVVRINA